MITFLPSSSSLSCRSSDLFMARTERKESNGVFDLQCSTRYPPLPYSLPPYSLLPLLPSYNAPQGSPPSLPPSLPTISYMLYPSSYILTWTLVCCWFLLLVCFHGHAFWPTRCIVSSSQRSINININLNRRNINNHNISF